MGRGCQKTNMEQAIRWRTVLPKSRPGRIVHKAQAWGVNVRYHDCRVISTQGPSNISALGAPTPGVFYSVSNIDVLHMQAENICSNIMVLGSEAL